MPAKKLKPLDKLVAEFTSPADAARVLRAYVKIHRTKLGLHWIYAAAYQLANGEPEVQVLEDFGYRPITKKRRGK